MAEKPKKSIQLILDDDEVAAVDRYRRTCENPPSRPAAIRQVLRKMGPHHEDPRQLSGTQGFHISTASAEGLSNGGTAGVRYRWPCRR